MSYHYEYSWYELNWSTRTVTSRTRFDKAALLCLYNLPPETLIKEYIFKRIDPFPLPACISNVILND